MSSTWGPAINDFNVLLTCAGRRNYLFQYFREALKGRGKVFAADLSPYAPAMLEAGKDTLSVPPVDDPAYFDRLLKACRARKIKLLLSLNDFELPGLSRQADRFREAGVCVIVSPPRVVDLCFDKWATFRKLMELGIPVPATFLGLAAARERAYAAVSDIRFEGLRYRSDIGWRELPALRGALAPATPGAPP